MMCFCAGSGGLPGSRRSGASCFPFRSFDCKAASVHRGSIVRRCCDSSTEKDAQVGQGFHPDVAGAVAFPDETDLLLCAIGQEATVEARAPLVHVIETFTILTTSPLLRVMLA